MYSPNNNFELYIIRNILSVISLNENSSYMRLNDRTLSLDKFFNYSCLSLCVGVKSKFQFFFFSYFRRNKKVIKRKKYEATIMLTIISLAYIAHGILLICYNVSLLCMLRCMRQNEKIYIKMKAKKVQ